MAQGSYKRPWKITFCAAFIIVSAFACTTVQQPVAPDAPSHTTVLTATLEPTPSLPAAVTIVPPPSSTPAFTQPPSTTPTGTGLFRPVTALPEQFPDPGAEMQLHAPADGSLWVLTRQAALRWDGQAWETVLSESEPVLAAVDDSGRLWVLRPEGSEIVAWQDGQWTAYGAESGWTQATTGEPSWWAPSPWSVASGAAGSAWLTTRQDVRAFDGTAWTVFPLETMGFAAPETDDLEAVYRLALGAGSGEVWVGECYYSGPGPIGGQGVRRFDGSAWQGAEAPSGAGCVPVIEVGPAGEVWLGANNTVWRYGAGGQAWTPYPMPEELRNPYNFAHPRQLIVDRNGDVWVMMLMCGGASCSGQLRLYRIHEVEWSPVIASDDPFTPLKQLAVDGSGQGWLFWDGQVYKLEAQTTIEPVGSTPARSVEVSPDGRLYILAEGEEDGSLWIFELRNGE